MPCGRWAPAWRRRGEQRRRTLGWQQGRPRAERAAVLCCAVLRRAASSCPGPAPPSSFPRRSGRSAATAGSLAGSGRCPRMPVSGRGGHGGPVPPACRRRHAFCWLPLGPHNALSPGPAEVLPGEYSNEECPQFEFTGEYLGLEARPPSTSEGERAAASPPRAHPRCQAVGLLRSCKSQACVRPNVASWKQPCSLFWPGQHRAACASSCPHACAPPHPRARPDEVCGKGFVPWSYPDIHPQLGKEAQR